MGKKDPDTPKPNPKIGQFQQSPSVPLSKTPDVKNKEKIRKKLFSRSSRFFAFLRTKKKQLLKKFRNMSATAKAAATMWKELPREDKKKYVDIATSEIDVYSNYKHTRNGKEEMTRKYSSKTDNKQDCYRGLQNKGNDCWLNTLLQCLNSLPCKTSLTAEEERCVTPVIFSMIHTLRKLNQLNEQAFYPDMLHHCFHGQFHYTPGEQNDIHESFSRLCCSGGGKYDNVLERHFQGSIQYQKTCTQCGNVEYCNPELFTSIFLALNSGYKKKVGQLVQESLNDEITACCDRCKKETIHTRTGTFVFLPETVVVVFKRFNHNDGYGEKIQTKVHLTMDIELETDRKIPYCLRACALHHGMHLQNGHYTALVFEENDTVIEIDNAAVREVSETWQDSSSTTVYMAFYCINNHDDNSDVPSNDRKHSEVDPQQTSDTNKRNPKKESNQRNVKLGEKKSVNKVQQQGYKDDNEVQCLYVWDISCRDKVVCNLEDGIELRGRDLKTLELPIVNKSYILENAGWLNDNVVDAYLSLLVKTSSKIGIQMFAYNSNFFTYLREVIKTR